MGHHLITTADGTVQFQSDKYPTCPPGKVPLSVEDTTAQDLLWVYAQRRREVDAEFSDDLESALGLAGYARTAPTPLDNLESLEFEARRGPLSMRDRIIALCDEVRVLRADRKRNLSDLVKKQEIELDALRRSLSLGEPLSVAENAATIEGQATTSHVSPRIDAALADLGNEHQPPPGWQDKVADQARLREALQCLMRFRESDACHDLQSSDAVAFDDYLDFQALGALAEAVIRRTANPRQFKYLRNQLASACRERDALDNELAELKRNTNRVNEDVRIILDYSRDAAKAFEAEIQTLRARISDLEKPVALWLSCPQCSTRHVDVGEYATKPHVAHTCQNKACGLTWRPAVVATVGVQFLPGSEDDPKCASSAVVLSPADRAAVYAIRNAWQRSLWGHGSEYDDSPVAKLIARLTEACQ